MGVQVNLATKDGKGSPLPINKRQFISFSYGGKNIEDFDLIVVFPNDRLDKTIYFPFNDITSKNEVVDGQMFWNSIFEAGKLSFNLATDGMTSENYENFKNWFAPGQIRELVLSEFSNRAILARVSAAPQISLLPFEEKKKIVIAGVEKEFSTSLYKGDISLEFVMDIPEWYSLRSCIRDEIENYNYTEEELKIIYEDKIPSIKMFSQEDSNIYLLADRIVIENGIIANIFSKDGTAMKDYPISINLNSSVYLYNCGTFPAKPKISFDFKPVFDENNKIISPGNSYTLGENSVLTIGEKEFVFTTPSLLTSYNYALKIVEEFGDNSSILELRQELRDKLYNHYTRAWAIAIIDSLKDKTEYVTVDGAILNTFKNKFIDLMKMCFIEEKEVENGEVEQNIQTITCEINSHTGESKIKTFFRVAEGKIILDTLENTSLVFIEENAGDMIKSKYLKLEDRTIFNSNGEITSEDCLKVSSTCDLENFKIDFKYTYL